MIINLNTLMAVGGSIIAFVILCIIAFQGFKQNSKKHQKDHKEESGRSDK